MRSFKFISLKLTPGKKHGARRVHARSFPYTLIGKQDPQLSEDTPSILIHLPGAFAKTKKATNILRPAIDVTFDKDAEFEVFSEVGVQEVRFFFFHFFVIRGWEGHQK